MSAGMSRGAVSRSPSAGRRVARTHLRQVQTSDGVKPPVNTAQAISAAR